MLSSVDIRQKFMRFFEEKAHHITHSAPIVVKDDPTLLFVNAGMVPFKKKFLGHEKPIHSRLANSQKCLRVSGKHNDLDEVGIDGYHHTMFEMLGNWSFGDYFKKEAIEWAWELITEVYKINSEDIYATVFEGSSEDKIPFDQESYDLWRKFLPEDRVLKAGKKDNFWEMGNTGPCGPCSELHLDMRSSAQKLREPGSLRVNQDDPYVIEIWNLVFIQYNRAVDGSLHVLPQKHVDTGMGLERLCRAIQGTKSNYGIDLFQPLIQKLSSISATPYQDSDAPTDVAFRVIVDHIRAVAHVLIDGQPFSNVGAGYVIRRILRRAVRYGYSYLDFREPFFWQLTQPWIDTFGAIFPEIKRNLGEVSLEEVIRREEELFFTTLSRGMSRLKVALDTTKDRQISGELVFELYDTYGFPVDMTAQILRERGKNYDRDAYQAALQAQKDRSRGASQREESAWLDADGRDIIKEGADKEASSFFDRGEQVFLGYDRTALDKPTKPLALREVRTRERTLYQLVFSETPFYAESGGQIGDMGWIHFAIPAKVKTSDQPFRACKVIDVQKEGGVSLHIISADDESLSDIDPLKTFFHTDTCRLEVDQNFRRETSRHHTATHLLHYALGQILGDHISQKGSKVSDQGLRFDFSHHNKLTAEEIDRVNEMVNQMIREAMPLEEQRKIPYKEALQQGAKALFDEKYGDEVRTIRFGNSLELCGGTHAKNTSELGIFHIVSETAVGSGIRRIEAIVSEKAHRYFQSQNHQISTVTSKLKAKSFSKGVERLLQSEEMLKKKVKKLERFCIDNLQKELDSRRETLGSGVDFIFDARGYLDAKGMKAVISELIRKERTVVLAASKEGAKVFLILGISKDIIEKTDLLAMKLIKELATEIDGSGGGSPSIATAGGGKADGVQPAMQKLKHTLESIIFPT